MGFMNDVTRGDVNHVIYNVESRRLTLNQVTQKKRAILC